MRALLDKPYLARLPRVCRGRKSSSLRVVSRSVSEMCIPPLARSWTRTCPHAGVDFPPSASETVALVTCLNPARLADVPVVVVSRPRYNVSYHLVFCVAVLKRSYARDSASVRLCKMSLFDNTVARGSVIVLVYSDLQTYEVRNKLLVSNIRPDKH